MAATTTTDSSTKPPTQAPPAPAPPPPPNEPDPTKDRGPATVFINNVLGEWRKYLTAVGAIATALIGYDLAQSLGKGDETPGGADQLAIVLSILAFGIGAALVLTIPILLNTANRATLSSAVNRQRRNNRWWNRFKEDRKVVGSEVLFGHDSVIEFEAAMVTSLTEARGYWETNGLQVPPNLLFRIKQYIAQRDEAQEYVAAAQVRSTSKLAIRLAALGLALGIGGYSNATYISNHASRRAELNDAADTRAEATAKQILTAELARGRAGAVLPVTPASVKIAFPDKASAASALGLAAATLPDACWNAGREGQAYDLATATGDAAPDRIVLVLLEATSDQCRAAVARVAPAWIVAPDLPVAATTTTAPTTTAPAGG